MSKPTSDKSASKNPSAKVEMVKTDALRPKNAETTCLRPLGLCDLGGCCDICWYGIRNKGAGKPTS